jgi:hypothetical protein
MELLHFWEEFRNLEAWGWKVFVCEAESSQEVVIYSQAQQQVGRPSGGAGWAPLGPLASILHQLKVCFEVKRIWCSVSVDAPKLMEERAWGDGGRSQVSAGPYTHISSVYTHIYSVQKIFMIWWNITICMHGIFLKVFLCLHGKYSCGFLHTVKIIHMGLKVFIMQWWNFYLMQLLKSNNVKVKIIYAM